MGELQIEVSTYLYYYIQTINDTSRPENPKELFNLRHASARNVVERLIGIFKRRFKILLNPPEYSLQMQAMIVPALAALHNFIRLHDSSDVIASASDAEQSSQNGYPTGPTEIGELGFHISAEERTQAALKRDRIALDMWADYQLELRRRL